MSRDDCAIVLLTCCRVTYSLIGIGVDNTAASRNSFRSEILQLHLEAPLSCIGFGLLGRDDDIHLNVAFFKGVLANGRRQSRSPEGVIENH